MTKTFCEKLKKQNVSEMYTFLQQGFIYLSKVTAATFTLLMHKSCSFERLEINTVPTNKAAIVFNIDNQHKSEYYNDF